MQKFIRDERTGIEYELKDGCYYPVFKDKFITEERTPLSKYGRLREEYLKEHKKILYNSLAMKGELYAHLKDIDDCAQAMAERITTAMAEKQGLNTERANMLASEWMGAMNNIRSCVDEIVLNDIVYT